MQRALLIPAGKLVRVKERSITDSDRRVLQDDGLLWVTGKNDADNSSSLEHVLYWCRSLATGEEHVWFHYELEVAEET